MSFLSTRFQQLFKRLAIKRTNEVAVLWEELHTHYTSRGRHYHNLQHLEHLFASLDQYPDAVNDVNAIELSIYYHDIIYRVTRKDNELKSAELAKRRLLALGLATSLVQKIYTQILATKNHLTLGERDQDLAVLLDMDLAILGADPAVYLQYTEAIRREYRIYPDLLYYPARRKAMESFLKREFIYQTAYFRALYEEKARNNIERFELL